MVTGKPFDITSKKTQNNFLLGSSANSKVQIQVIFKPFQHFLALKFCFQVRTEKPISPFVFTVNNDDHFWNNQIKLQVKMCTSETLHFIQHSLVNIKQLSNLATRMSSTSSGNCAHL